VEDLGKAAVRDAEFAGAEGRLDAAGAPGLASVSEVVVRASQRDRDEEEQSAWPRADQLTAAEAAARARRLEEGPRAAVDREFRPGNQQDVAADLSARLGELLAQPDAARPA